MKLALSRQSFQKLPLGKLEEISGQQVYRCYQCGRCSAGCPMVEAMDFAPGQVIHMLQTGVLDDNTSGSPV